VEIFVLAARTAGEQDSALLVHNLMKMYATRSNVVPEMACELLWVGFLEVSDDIQRGCKLTIEDPIVH
jgi:hypothetical protein